MHTQRFVVIGLGNFGASAAEALYEEGHDVIALDVNEERVDVMAPHVSRSAVGDGRERETLEKIGADGANGAIVSTGDDITASILATLALKDLGVEDIYVKVVSRDHARVVEHLGVTDTIFPERESALNLASRLSDSAVLNYVRMTKDLSVQEMVVPKRWQGQTLRDLSLRAKPSSTKRRQRTDENACTRRASSTAPDLGSQKESALRGERALPIELASCKAKNRSKRRDHLVCR